MEQRWCPPLPHHHHPVPPLQWEGQRSSSAWCKSLSWWFAAARRDVTLFCSWKPVAFWLLDMQVIASSPQSQNVKLDGQPAFSPCTTQIFRLLLSSNSSTYRFSEACCFPPTSFAVLSRVAYESQTILSRNYVLLLFCVSRAVGWAHFNLSKFFFSELSTQLVDMKSSLRLWRNYLHLSRVMSQVWAVPLFSIHTSSEHRDSPGWSPDQSCAMR